MAEPDATHPIEWPIPRQEVLGDRNGPLAWLQYALVRAVLGVVTSVPDRPRDALVAGIARLGARFDRRHSDAARRFLTQAFGDDLGPTRREELVRAAWRLLFGNVLNDVLYERRVLRDGDPLAHYSLELCDDVERVREAGTGALIVTGHFGAWEAFPLLSPLLGYEPMYAVARPPRNRPLSALLQRSREERGIRLLHRHGAVRSITRVLSKGGYVAMLVDQRARGKTVVAPFFGRPAHCERSVSVVLKRARVPLIVAGCYEAERPFHYDVVVPKVFWPEELEGWTPEQMMTAINGQLERMIMARPEQYLWLHDRYRKGPAADALEAEEPALQA
jgi:KDO2-lipid IV(A) lauroyltransferase